MDEPVYVALDSTGVKVYKSGDRIRRRFKVMKGYLRVHIAIDFETRQIAALEVTESTYTTGRGLKISWRGL